MYTLGMAPAASDNHSFRYAFVQREKMGVFLSADYADCRLPLLRCGKSSKRFLLGKD
jgi:hypothetical protein